MAKITDLQRLLVVDELYRIKDLNGNSFFHSSELRSFKIEFGQENTKTGLGRISVTAQLYIPYKNTLTYKFYGYYSHLTDSCDFRSVEVDEEFKVTLLLAIDCATYKINRTWLLEEEEEEGDVLGVHAGVCPEVAVADVDSDSYTKYCAVNSSLL